MHRKPPADEHPRQAADTISLLPAPATSPDALTRREFLGALATVSAAAVAPARFYAQEPATDSLIIDAHIHLFNPARPGGVPWPKAEDKVLYQPALPARYAALAQPLHVCASIAIECSPLPADNDWLLHTAASSDWIVAVIGDLDPANDQFAADLDRFASNPLFRGIRYGNLWNRDLHAQLANPRFIAHLRLLAHRGLVLESANPTPQLVDDLLRIARAVPDLRIVIDHLPQAVPPNDPAQHASYLATLHQLSQEPNVHVKGSEILRRINGTVPTDLNTYRPWLDTLWDLFGEDRIFFGSDWPNSDQLSPLRSVFQIAHAYFDRKGPQAAHKYFAQNSVKIYHWQPRTQRQQTVAKSVHQASTFKESK